MDRDAEKSVARYRNYRNLEKSRSPWRHGTTRSRIDLYFIRVSVYFQPRSTLRDKVTRSGFLRSCRVCFSDAVDEFSRRTEA